MPDAIRLNWPPRNDGGTGPSDRQTDFLRCSARYQLYGGSKRGGKTVAGCAKAIYLSVLFPGNRGLVARAFYPDLRDSTISTFFRLCPPELILSYNRTEHAVTLMSSDATRPSTVNFRSLGEESEGSASRSKDRVKGAEYGWIWVDEPSEVSAATVDMLDAQLCWSLPDGNRPPYMLMLTSNPEPGWVKDRYVDAAHADYIIGRADAEYIHSLPSDNPGLPEGWEQALRATRDADWVRRYLDGSWDIAEGGVFGRLNPVWHDLDNFVPADRWTAFCRGLRLVGGMDYGSTGVTAYVLCGTDTAGNMYALEEWYGRDMLISQHAEGIRALERQYGRTPEYRVIDPSTDAGTLQGPHEMYSVRQAFSEPKYGHVSDSNAVATIPARRHEISVGIDRMNEMLNVGEARRHPFSGTFGAPSLFLSKSRCPNLWREMAGLKKVVASSGKLDFKGDDHACDCLRYCILSRPSAADAPKPDESSMTAFDRMMAASHRAWVEKSRRGASGGSIWR